MLATPNTTVTVLNSDSVDPYTGERVNEAAAVTGVPATILERPATRPRTGSEGRTVEDPATTTPRLVRIINGRVPPGTPVTRTSRVLDERTNKIYGVKAMRRHSNTHPHADIILELIAPGDPDDL